MNTEREIGATTDAGRVARLLNVAETAKQLSLGRSKVYEMIARGELPHVRLGSAVRVPLIALEAWIGSRTEGGDN